MTHIELDDLASREDDDLRRGLRSRRRRGSTLRRPPAPGPDPRCGRPPTRATRRHVTPRPTTATPLPSSPTAPGARSAMRDEIGWPSGNRRSRGCLSFPRAVAGLARCPPRLSRHRLRPDEIVYLRRDRGPDGTRAELPRLLTTRRCAGCARSRRRREHFLLLSNRRRSVAWASSARSSRHEDITDAGSRGSSSRRVAAGRPVRRRHFSRMSPAGEAASSRGFLDQSAAIPDRVRRRAFADGALGSADRAAAVLAGSGTVGKAPSRQPARTPVRPAAKIRSTRIAEALDATHRPAGGARRASTGRESALLRRRASTATTSRRS